MRLRTLCLMTIAAVCGLSTAVQAQIFRGCRGYITVSSAMTSETRLAELDASGRCDNRREGNTCRDRASRRIRSCAEALGTQRNVHTLPWQCENVLRQETRVNWFYWDGVDTTPFPNGPFSGHDRIARNVCCGSQPQSGLTDFTIGYRSIGDRGCTPSQGRFTGIENITIAVTGELNCAAEVARGVCGPVDPPPQGELDRAPEPVRTNPPTRTNPPPPPPPANAGGDGEIRLGN